jgi:hypothetical protein
MTPSSMPWVSKSMGNTSPSAGLKCRRGVECEDKRDESTEEEETDTLSHSAITVPVHLTTYVVAMGQGHKKGSGPKMVAKLARFAPR